MTRFDWLRKEVEVVPRKKFFVFEPVSSVELEHVEKSFGPLPRDYKEFVEEFGKAKMFLAPRTPLYLLEVIAPPRILRNSSEAGRRENCATFIKLGYYVNTGSVGLAWLNGQ